MLFTTSLLKSTPIMAEALRLPWWWAAGEKGHSVSQQRKPGSSESREALSSVNQGRLLQTGTEGSLWSCCSQDSDLLMRLDHPEKLGKLLKLELRKELWDGVGGSWPNSATHHCLCC